MKHPWIFIILIPCVFSLTACKAALNYNAPFDLIRTYRDIPGINAEEISAIEALKNSRTSFTYGTNLTTENFLLPDGTHAGFTWYFCDLLSNLFEISFIPEIFEWDVLMEKLDSGSIDFTGELTPTAERLDKYCMTSPIAGRLLRIYTASDSDWIKTENDIEGSRLGFLEGTITADSIRRTYPEKFVKVDIPDYPAAARMIADREIDAFVEEAVSDPAFEAYDFIRSEIFFPMIYESVSMTTANPELAPVISAMDKYLASGGIDKLHELYKEGDFDYKKFKFMSMLTDAEKVYINEHRQRPIPVIYEYDNYPVNFYNENEKEFQGIALDILAEIGLLTGLKFEAAIEDEIWADLFEKVKTGEVPMVAQLLVSEARKESFIWSAVPYSHSFYAIMSKSDFPNLESYQVGRHTVGVMRQSGHADIYRELFPDNRNLREYDNIGECLDALEKGEVKLLMASEYILLAQTHYHEKPEFKINIRLNVPMDSYFGFGKNETVLCSIIDKAQGFVNTGLIEINWTGRAFDYSKKIAEQRTMFLTFSVSILAFLLIITTILLVNNWVLGKRLKKIASHDDLTGILNRRYFLELGLTQMDRSMRLGKGCLLIIFDLDHFKLINDKYGHQAGDRVLREAANRVKKMVRPYDLFGRYGGEEFIILMFDTKKSDAINAAERIRMDLCRAPIEFDGKKLSISASFGISYAAPVNDMDTAIKYADKALYRAKERGRNLVIFYED